MSDFKRSVDVHLTVSVRGQLTEKGDCRELEAIAESVIQGAAALLAQAKEQPL